jgi:hypothetical protein
VQDAVFAEGLGGHAEPDGHPVGVHRPGVDRGAEVDEQVGVGGARPGHGAVVQVCGQPFAHWRGEGHHPAGQVEPAVADVGEQQPGDLAGRGAAERDDGQGGPGGVAAVQGLPQRGEAGGQRLPDLGVAGGDAGGRVGEGDLVALRTVKTDLSVNSAASGREQARSSRMWAPLVLLTPARAKPGVTASADRTKITAG